MLTETNIFSLQTFLTRKTLYATVAVTLDIFFFAYVHLRCRNFSQCHSTLNFWRQVPESKYPEFKNTGI